MAREPRWARTDPEAKASRKALRIASVARRASRAFDRWWRWSGVDEAKEARAFDTLRDRMADLRTAITDKADLV